MANAKWGEGKSQHIKNQVKKKKKVFRYVLSQSCFRVYVKFYTRGTVGLEYGDMPDREL
jgi:hypothetical protein